MTPDHPSTESELRRIKPSMLDRDLLDRLEACTDGSLTVLTPTELQFEAALSRITPEALPSDLLADLEGIVANVPFARNEKVVLFPKAKQNREKARRFPRPMWAAAAAVALMGASSALLMPTSQKQAPVAKVSTAPVLPSNSSNVVSATYDAARDEGVIWNPNDQPRRVLSFRSKDRVDYVLIPEKGD